MVARDTPADVRRFRRAPPGRRWEAGRFEWRALRHGGTRIGVCGFRACETLDIRPARHELAWRTVGEALTSGQEH